ncbi:helix-turn-helix transcriptional regulator [Cellulomonas soli]|nr:helix-turn-helix transcriptional regulator [Cellulomonas soli]
MVGRASGTISIIRRSPTMLIDDVWVALWRAHDIKAATLAGTSVHGDVVLAGPGFSATAYEVQTLSVLHPSRIRRHLSQQKNDHRGRPLSRDGADLLVVEAASPAALEVARVERVSVLIAPDRGPVRGTLIDADDVEHTIDAGDASAEARPGEARRRGRTPWGTYSLLLEMLRETEPRSQTTLAAEVGVTQARASQALNQLSGLVERRARGWTVTSQRDAAQWLVERYPRPRLSSTWLTLDDPVPATQSIARLLSDARVRYAVTGQVAADVIAPWARPTRTTIWTDRLVDLEDAGCTPVTSVEATVTIAVPDDPRALTSTSERHGLVVADSWRVWLTLMQDGDVDAANHLQSKLVAEASA